MKRLDWTQANEKVEYEACCRVCGRPDSLDPAHIIPRSRGGDMASLNIVPLCRGCHSAYDSGKLELLPSLRFTEQAHAVSLVGVAEVYRRTTL